MNCKTSLTKRLAKKEAKKQRILNMMVNNLIKQTCRIIKEEEKEQKLLAKKELQRKQRYCKTREKIKNTFGKECKYYNKEQKKAIFKNPISEIAYNWKNNIQKKCSKCKQMKGLHNYSRNDCGGGNIIRSDGLRNRRPDCKSCYSIANKGKKQAQKLAKALGIPYKAPKGTHCVLCDCLPSNGNPLVFDHCHINNVFRGYCCNNCNKGMGLLGDNVPSLCNVIKYMNKTEKYSKEEMLSMLGY